MGVVGLSIFAVMGSECPIQGGLLGPGVAGCGGASSLHGIALQVEG